MASLKDIKYKVVAIRKTKQITRAMNMVSTAKLRSAQRNAEHFSEYSKAYQGLLSSMLNHSKTYTHALLSNPSKEAQAVGVILVTPDRGLCGAFAGALIQECNRFITEQVSQGKEVLCYAIGRKGYEAVKKMPCTIVDQEIGTMSSIQFESAQKVADTMQTLLLEGRISEVHIIYGHFVSLMAQDCVQQRLLPINVEQTVEEDVQDILYEPSSTVLLDEIIPRISAIRLYDAILDTIVSEHAARMIAMNNATKNCDDLIASFSRLYNKVRQAAVTKELMDIVGGAEALNS